MASASVLKLIVDDKEYNAILKQAAQGMKHLEQTLKDSGKSFDKVDKSVVDYVREIGKMEAQAKTAKGKIGEMSNAFVELSTQYNKMSDDVKKSDVGKALADSMEQLKQRTIAAKKELQDLNGQLSSTKAPDIKPDGGLFGGDGFKGMLAVFGGNLMTKAAGWMANLGSEIVNVMNESSQLAMQAEGVQIAFAKLGDGTLLDGLREATHGTVNDFELMKAAVKFNDFKLPVEELGTMLAFAQQKAKDTGQSVDYMVDSIVTGLGRKSLMILDNLGLSAAEVKEKMAETGDMTKAVGQIIREQMSKAGDYVETASDRAAQANVELENAMLELGNAMRETFGYDGWETMAAGIKTELVGAITFTIETINEAKQRLKEFLQMLGVLDKAPAPKPTPTSGPDGAYYETTDAQGNRTGAGRWMNGQMVQTEAADVIVTGSKSKSENKKKKKGSGHSSRHTAANVVEKTEEQLNNEKINKLTQEYIKASEERKAAIRGEIKVLQDRQEVISNLKLEALGKSSPVMKIDPAQVGNLGSVTGYDNVFKGMKEGVTSVISPLQALNEELKRLQEGQALALTPEQWQIWQEAIDKTNKKISDFTGGGKKGEKSWKDAATAVQAVGSAMQGIEDPAAKVMGTIAQAIASIALGYAQATVQAGETGGPWAWIAFAASGLATMLSTISAIHSATGYAQGGIVDGRGGGFVPGNTFSGDNVGNVFLDSGELILNKSQQNSLANVLTGNPMSSMRLSAVVSGEQILLVANRTTRRQGRGELVTFR